MNNYREKFQRLKSALEGALGTPFHAQTGFVLYNMDCIEAMRALIAAKISVDLVLTSPPYNLDKPKEYETKMPLKEYVAFSARWMELASRQLTPKGALWLNLGYTGIPGKGRAIPLAFHLWNLCSSLYLQQHVIWSYGAGPGFRRIFSSRHEDLLWFVKDSENYTFNLDQVRIPAKYPNQKKGGKLRSNPLGANPKDVWDIPKVTSGAGRSSKERTPHPAQMPLAVAERIILASSDPGDIVFDPFSGSATTGIAALKHGRIFIGFELKEDYCEIAKQRAITSAKDI